MASLETYTSLEIPTFTEGRCAALNGMPFNEHADDIWKDGFSWGLIERSRRERRLAQSEAEPVSVAAYLTAARQRACLRPPNGENK